MSVLLPIGVLVALGLFAFTRGARADSGARGDAIIGDIEVTPGPFPVKGVEYIIKPNDYPALIAQRFTRNPNRWQEIVNTTNAFGPPKYQSLKVETEKRKSLITKDNPQGLITLVKPFSPGQVILLPAEWFEDGVSTGARGRLRLPRRHMTQATKEQLARMIGPRKAHIGSRNWPTDLP